jgi:hypothetical protein
MRERLFHIFIQVFAVLIGNGMHPDEREERV